MLNQEPFDLVLMDIQMPKMDGFDATKEIRRQEEQTGRHIPIIAMTAHAMKGDRQRCLDAGMDEYLSKPIRIQELVQVLDAVKSDTSTQPSQSPAIIPSPSGLVDWDEALDIVNGNHELLKEIVQAFLDDTPRLISAAQQAIAEKNAEALALAAHSLKGSMLFLKAQRPGDLAQQLELMGNHDQFDNADNTFQALQKQIQTLSEELKDFLQSEK